MKDYFGYIRVSTAKQGEKGVSLQEQKGAIENYARHFGLHLSQWFEETETAAKRGRPIFGQMLRQLQHGRANGVVIHKIDRGARNLRDWADLGEIIDKGIEVHFANESLDLNSRGGRLSADIQAVVASDYIRNLREETRKGFYGRLKQGFYPIQAPIGYLDQGKARAKVHDPERAPLVAQAFGLYATGTFSLPRLLDEMHRRGLSNRRGGKLCLNGLSTMLNNSFYTGLMRIRKTGEVFPGNHVPLISKSVFERVQLILQGKTVNRITKHGFTFRRKVRCSTCNYSLVGEQHKGHVYYRCHTRTCPSTIIREDQINESIVRAFAPLQLDEQELDEARSWIKRARANGEAVGQAEAEQCKLRLSQVQPRLARLTDAVVDGLLDREAFNERKQSLLSEQQELQERLAYLADSSSGPLDRVEQYLELAKTLKTSYELALSENKRRLVEKLTSNLTATRKNVDVELKPEAQTIANRPQFACCSPDTRTPRTFDAVLETLLQYFTKNLPEPD